MRNFSIRPVFQMMIALWIVCVMLAGRAAMASEAVGWITLLDEENDQIVLDSGKTFALTDDIGLSSLAGGKRVRVTYETIGGVPTLTGIALEAPQAENPTLDTPYQVCINTRSSEDRRRASERGRQIC